MSELAPFRRRITVLFVALTSACGDSGTGGGSEGGSDSGGGPATGGSTNEGGGAAGGGDPGPSLPGCRQTCAAPRDCDPPAPNALTDADNWACPDSRCDYLGCLSDAECESVFMSADYVCREQPGSGVPACLRRCNAASECATTSALYDEDNWSCSDSFCQFLGCNSTEECQTTLASAEYECIELEGDLQPSCHHTCSVPLDCVEAAVPTSDEDNWDCVGSRCIYRGCQSTSECQQTLMADDYVCE